MSDPLLELGVKTQDLVAGLAGGVVNAFVFKRGTPIAIVGSVVVGALTAAYLTEPAARLTGTTGGATAFIVGLGAMAICQGILSRVGKWNPAGSKGDADAS